MRRVQIRIEHLSGPEDGKIVGFSKDRVIIGRAEDCDLVLAHDSTVSRRHAQVLCEGESLFIEDLGSTHGTFVDGQRITARTELRTGAIIRMGNTYLRVPT
ncbi:MAG: FHA domain-containing protein [Armatimonadetes bacterium]|nr:FHA domain-containing protein [Armatimonadota bacterium]